MSNRSAHIDNLRNLAKHQPSVFAVPDLESCEGKVRRAECHLKKLRDEIGPFDSEDNYSIRVEHNPEAAEYVFKVEGIAELDPNWGYVAGDCIHNLRSALDHLVVQLAVVGQGGQRLTEDQVKRCDFPVFNDPTDFKKKGGERSIGLLREGERTRIRELQPYNAVELSIWGPPAIAGTPPPATLPGLLDWLTRLDNIDKHRRVNAAWRSPAWHEFFAANLPEPFRQGSIETGSLKEDAKIGSWGYAGTAIRVEPPSEMDVKRHFPIRVSIGQTPGSYGYPALDLLDWFVGGVKLVIDLFRPCVLYGEPADPVRDLDVPFDSWMTANYLSGVVKPPTK